MFQDIKFLAARPDVGSIIALAAALGSDEGVAREAEKYMSSDNLSFYGWVDEGDVLGICGFEVHADKVEIHLIAVAEGRQRVGIGSAMVWALQKQYPLPLEAETVEEAVGFYRKLGFVVTPFPDAEWGVKYTCILSGMTPASAIEIERAAESDMAEILSLQHLAYRSEARLHNDFSIQPLTQTLAEVIAEFHKGTVIKAVEKGKIIGSVRAYEADGTVYIGKLMVHPDYQGHGLGKRLLLAIEQSFPDRERFELYTSCKSDRNLKLYETCGYSRFREDADPSGIAFAYLEKRP